MPGLRLAMRLSIGCDLANRQVAACGNGRIVADHQNYGDDYINCRNDLIVFMGVGRIDFSEIISRIRSAIITDAMQPRMGSTAACGEDSSTLYLFHGKSAANVKHCNIRFRIAHSGCDA